MKSYSQFSEDIQILKFFQNDIVGYYVEVGSNDGLTNSNTALLELNGWKGILIEANPDLISKSIQSRPNSIVVNYAVVSCDRVGTVSFYKVVGGPPSLDGLSTIIGDENFVSRITSYGGEVKVIRVLATTLDNILTSNNVPSDFSFLSIDVEGADLEVLKGLSLNIFQPRIILVEDGSFGADWSVRNYLKSYGYIRVHRTGVNDWYVKSKDANKFIGQRLILTLRLFKWWLMRVL